MKYNMVYFSLSYLAQLFCIEYLADNKRPMDGKEYITVDEDTDTMVIQSLFNKHNDYVIPRVSTVYLEGKLGSVYDEEIRYLKDKLLDIVKYYMQPDFGDDYEINFDIYRGLLCIIVEVRNPSNPLRPYGRKYKISLETLSKVNNLSIIVQRIFATIRDSLLTMLDKEKAAVSKAVKDQLNSIYGMSGADFDGDILAKGELTKHIKELRDSMYREFGVPESVINTKEHTAEYEHVMAAIRSTSGNYKGGYMRDYTSMYGKAIKKVIFNDPATIVMWNDGTKTVVKKHGDVEFNGEAAVMYAYVLRWHFNNNRKSMRIWLKQNAKRFEWQSEKPKKITVTRTSKGKITKASQKEIYEAMTPEQKEVVNAMIQDAVKESKKTSKVTKKAAEGGKNEDIR